MRKNDVSDMDLVPALEQTLSQILHPAPGDANAQIKAATDRLRHEFYPQPASAAALVQVLTSSQDPQMRQLAGVEARKILPRHWKDIAPGDRVQLREAVLQSALAEPVELVRHTSARVVSIVATQDLENDEWAQLIPILFAAAQDTQASKREVGLYIVYALLDQDYTAAMSERATELLKLFSATINDPESSIVRVTTVLALCGLTDVIMGNNQLTAVFQGLVPKMAEILNQSVRQGDEKSALQLFEVFNDLVMGDASLLGETFSDLLKHMITDYAVKTDEDDEIRLAALRYVFNAVRFRPSRIKALGFGPELVKALLQILSTTEPDEDDDDDDDEGLEKLSLRTLDCLSSSLSPSQVIEPLIALVPSLSQGTPEQMRAGYLAFSVTISGAPEFVSGEFTTILPWVCSGLQSEVAYIRIAALRALSMLALELPNLVGKEHAVLMPLIFSVMDGAQSLQMARAACTSLDTLVSTLDRVVITDLYLSSLVPKLLDAVDQAPDLKLQGAVVNALGSAALAAGRNYSPFFERTVHTIERFVIVPTDDLQPQVAQLSSETLDTLGTLCAAVGPDMFRPYLPAVLQTAIQCMQCPAAALRESGPVFVSSASRVFGPELAPQLPQILPLLYKTFDKEEFEVDDLLVEDDGGVGMEEDESAGIRVNSDVALEKEYGCDCLNDLIENIPSSSLQPFLNDIAKHLVDLAGHFYEDVRKSAIVGLWRLYKAVPTPDVLKAVRDTTVEALETEVDLGTVDASMECLSEALRRDGAVVFGSPEDLEKIMLAIFEVLNKTHPAIAGDEDDDGLDEAEKAAAEAAGGSEAAEALADTAVDLVVAVAGAMGPVQFAPVFPQLAKTLQDYVKSRTTNERVTGVVAFAELTGVLKEGMSPWTQELLQVFGSALQDKRLQVRSMGAYGVGLLCYFSVETETVRQAYPEILTGIQHLFKGGLTDSIATANACGCVSRMAVANQDLVPEESALSAITALLPLEGGYEEYEPIFAYLATLANQQSSVLKNSGIKQKVLQVFEQQNAAEKLNEVRFAGEPAPVQPLGDANARKAAEKVLNFLN